jgi:hypothetical protein
MDMSHCESVDNSMKPFSLINYSLTKACMSWYGLYLPVLFRISDGHGSGIIVVIPRNDIKS